MHLKADLKKKITIAIFANCNVITYIIFYLCKILVYKSLPFKFKWGHLKISKYQNAPILLYVWNFTN